MFLAGGAQRFDKRQIEDVAQRPADGGLAGDAVEAFESAVPAHNPFAAVEHGEAVVERFEDVLVELPHPIELLRLAVQLAIEASVLDGRGHLAGDRRQQRQVLAVERLVALLAAERQHGDGAAFKHAGHEVVGAGVAPEFHFLGGEARGRNRIVEGHGRARVEARHHRRGARQSRHQRAEAVVANRGEVAGAVVGEHQRHPVDHQRLDHARDQALTEADHVEIAVQLAGERDQRAAIVVAIAVEHPIDGGVHPFFHRLRQQHDDNRGQQGDNPGVLVAGVSCRADEKRRQPEQRRVQRQRRAEECGVGERALDDHLNVAQAVAHDRRRERQRHHAERNRGELQRERRIEAERPRQRVAEGKRSGAKRRAPGQPAQLAPCRCRRDLVKGAGQDRRRHHGAGAQLQLLGAIERRRRRRQKGAIRRAADDCHEPAGDNQQRRSVDQRQQRHRSAGLARRKHHGEMQQQRREQRDGDGVAPVENPVEAIERPVERERVGAEERRAQPEKVQRRLIVRPAQANQPADNEREQTDRGENVVQRAALRHRRERDLERLARAEPQQ